MGEWPGRSAIANAGRNADDEREYARSLIVQVLEDHARFEVADGRSPIPADVEGQVASAIHSALFGGRLEPLLSDPDGTVRERFGVKRGFSMAPTKRVTFVIAEDRTVLEVVRSELRMSAHADRALAALRTHRD